MSTNNYVQQAIVTRLCSYTLLLSMIRAWYRLELICRCAHSLAVSMTTWNWCMTILALNIPHYNLFTHCRMSRKPTWRELTIYIHLTTTDYHRYAQIVKRWPSESLKFFYLALCYLWFIGCCFFIRPKRTSVLKGDWIISPILNESGYHGTTSELRITTDVKCSGQNVPILHNCHSSRKT